MLFYKICLTALALASIVFAATKNYEFLLYAVTIAVMVGFLWATHSSFHYRRSSLCLFFIWLVMHVCGGCVPIGDGKVLYDLILLPLVPAPYSILKFDQFVHAFCYLAIGLLADDAIRPQLRRDIPPVAAFLIVVLAAMGVGALNEVIEFAAVCSFENTNVGDYTNNALDLVFNMAGALTAAAMRWQRVKPVAGP